MPELSHAAACIHVPDGRPCAEAIARCTHVGIGAHPDDVEFMAFHGIAECFDADDRWFGAVVCTDGAGSARAGRFAASSDTEMQAIRRAEQIAAAGIGRYGAVLLLGHSSRAVRQPLPNAPARDLRAILAAARPEVVYTHNPADKHATHTAVLRAVMAAIHALPHELRPRRVLGCEVWRDLDWLPDDAKTVLDVGGRDDLAAALCSAFASQLSAKRYDLAVAGRRLANATFLDPYRADGPRMATFAIDLTAFALDASLDLEAHMRALVERFRDDVVENLRGSGRPA